MEVYNELEMRDVTNVFGIMKGREEPGEFSVFHLKIILVLQCISLGQLSHHCFVSHQ